MAHPGVDKVAFTGSTAVGKLINKAATDTLKRVSLELGGKSPVIVLPDADMSQVIGGAANAIFFNAGQVCCAGTRLFAHKKVFDQVLEGVSAAAQSIKLGPGLDPQTQMGPLVSREQQERVLGYIDSGRKDGAKVMTGGDAPFVAGLLRQAHRAHQRSPRHEDRARGDFRAGAGGTAVRGSRRHRRDGERHPVRPRRERLVDGTSVPCIVSCRRSRRAPSGSTATTSSIPAMPFGGFKQSGFGREHGRAVIDLYTELKSVCIAV